mmetsp:Transcript_15372/g.17110  ORF Transcript_15372/g.17110 Transcript_15372/m.17110 type:complete len:168 (+) Transcript_15372:229-732(+)
MVRHVYEEHANESDKTMYIAIRRLKNAIENGDTEIHQEVCMSEYKSFNCLFVEKKGIPSVTLTFLRGLAQTRKKTARRRLSKLLTGTQCKLKFCKFCSVHCTHYYFVHCVFVKAFPGYDIIDGVATMAAMKTILEQPIPTDTALFIKEFKCKYFEITGKNLEDADFE